MDYTMVGCLTRIAQLIEQTSAATKLIWQFMKKKMQKSALTPGDVRGISRRDFVNKTALIGAGLAIGPLLLSACSDKPKVINNGSAQGLPKEENTMQTRN
jgi:hypothetical protein